MYLWYGTYHRRVVAKTGSFVYQMLDIGVHNSFKTAGFVTYSGPLACLTASCDVVVDPVTSRMQ